MLYSSKDLFGMAKLGYARLPHIGEYREGISGDSPIEIPDDEITGCSEITRKYYYKKNINNAWYRTLSRKGLERFRKELWVHFDEYQNNNEPRYLDKKGSRKRKKLTEEEFYNTIVAELDHLDLNTMRERYFLTRKLKILEEMCAFHNLDYSSFSNEMDKKYEEKAKAEV